jgi:stage V sporulation protein AD
MHRSGKHTVVFDAPPSVLGYAAVAANKEAQGPLARHIDALSQDALFGQQSWEKAESEMQRMASAKALEKARLSPADIGCLFAGDLINQCTVSTYGAGGMDMPYMGLYSACANMAEGLAAAAVFVEAGACGRAMAVTSSHFCSAERQYRYPLEYGGARAPTSQWTVTGAGAAVLGQNAGPPYVRAAHIGRVTDKGIKNSNNMGAAMAPAAARTLIGFFEDMGSGPESFDLILTGDLASVGSELLKSLMRREGYELGERHDDCGLMIYDREAQKMNAGASGCGCCATVLCSYVLGEIEAGRLNDVLFIATGAIMSPTSVQQGQSIAAVAHLVHISSKM